MSKLIVIGDIHGRATWKFIIEKEKDADIIVFVGDYFDSYDIKTETQVNNFLDIIEFKKTSDKEVILLIGNHDHHYFPEIGESGTGGYQQVGKYQISPILDQNKRYLQIAYNHGNFLFTHAGVSEIFMNDCLGKDGWEMTAEAIAEDVNELWKHKPLAFTFNGFEQYGDNQQQTPIWIRPRSLMKGGQSLKKKGIIQVVGHTQQDQIDIKGKATGGKYFFIDTLGTSKQYLIIQDTIVSCSKI